MHFAISDYVLDIAHNAVEAGPGLVRIDIDESAESLGFEISDDGCGMTEEEVGRSLDPFWTDGRKHVKRRVGLGLPFLVQGVQQAGREFRIESGKGRGTLVSFSFPTVGPDVPPVGDMAGLLFALSCIPGDHEMRIRRRRNLPGATLDYEVTRSELAEVLGGFERADTLTLLRDYLRSQEEDDE
ncbi:MAG: ATP-binding protein [Spirochaetota bacterium]